MKMLTGIIAVHMYIVDKTTEHTVIAETVDTQGQVEMVELPRFVIPCELSEGDMFYFLEASGVIEIRCGEPEPS